MLKMYDEKLENEGRVYVFLDFWIFLDVKVNETGSFLNWRFIGQFF